MRLFSWLGKLLDSMISWLGKVATTFVRGLIWSLQRMWEAVIVETLIAAFGLSPSLYLVFYAGRAMNESFMEVWSPNRSKPSEVFKLVHDVENGNPLPINRYDSQVFVLENWN